MSVIREGGVESIDDAIVEYRVLERYVGLHQSPHALVAALALLSEDSPVAENLLGEYRLDLGMLIGYDRGKGHEVGVMPGPDPRQL